MFSFFSGEGNALGTQLQLRIKGQWYTRVTDGQTDGQTDRRTELR